MLFIANEQAERGGAAVIYGKKGGLEELLHKDVIFVEAVDFNNYADEIFDYIAANCRSNPIIWASHPFDLSILYSISKRLRRHKINHSIVCGVYHPRASFKPEDSRITEWICRANFFSADSHHLYFMNDAVEKSHRARWGKLRNDLKTLPIVFPERRPRNRSGSEDSVNLVSVGRLVPWKSFNYAIPEVMKKLQLSGVKARWKVFGDGPLLEPLRALSAENGTAKDLHFLGAVEFSQLDNVLGSADIFVGMGTSLLEAALRGIPSIVAIDSYRNHTYGFLNEIPVGNIGEQQEDEPEFSILEKIMQYIDMSASERAAIGAQCLAAARAQTSRPGDVVSYFQSLRIEGRLSLPQEAARGLMGGYRYAKAFKGRVFGNATPL